MGLEINVRGIQVQLCIHGYEPSRKNSWDSQWCKCDHAFRSGDWLNYRKDADEVLLSSEVEALEHAFTKLLQDELTEPEMFRCMEPDYVFTLYPKQDLRKDPHYTYIPPGQEIKDIIVEWNIYFWHEGLTDNFLTLTLKRDEITQFRNYLSFVITGQ